MDDTAQKRHATRARRTRTRLAAGPAARARLSVFRSLQHIYAQLIDDASGNTIAAAGSMDTAPRKAQSAPPPSADAPAGKKAKKKKAPKVRLHEKGNTCAVAREVGLRLAERAKAEGVSKVVFDRGGYLYHGRVKALAEGAREGGLEF